MPNSEPPAAALNPGPIMAMMTAFEQTAALKAAIALDLFTALGEEARDAEGLAKRCGCAVKGARVLADAMTVYGLLKKDGPLYSLTPAAAAYLDGRAETYIGDAARFLSSSERLRQCFDDPAGWARRGGADTLANTTPESSVWVDFARGMSGFMSPVADAVVQALADKGLAPRRVLDVAAGHGQFGIKLALQFKDAEVFGLDWPDVVDVAQENAVAAGVGDRYRILIGDAFAVEIGVGYDLVLVPNFLHHFTPDKCVEFLRKAHAALAPGGSVAIVEFAPDATRVSPPGPALFALTMLTSTPDGDAYPAQELDKMCVAAGFADIQVVPMPPTAQTLVLAQRGHAQVPLTVRQDSAKL